MRHLWVCVSGLIAFPAYWLTLAPTLQVADAGDQIAPAHFLGVSLPTGTPLYLLLMKGRSIPVTSLKRTAGLSGNLTVSSFTSLGSMIRPGRFLGGSSLSRIFARPVPPLGRSFCLNAFAAGRSIKKSGMSRSRDYTGSGRWRR